MGKAELKAGQSKNLNLRACNFSTQSLEENLRDIKNGFYLYFRKESFLRDYKICFSQKFWIKE